MIRGYCSTTQIVVERAQISLGQRTARNGQ